DNGDRARHVFGGTCRNGTPCDDDVHPEPDQLGRILPEPLDVARAPPILQDDNLALDISKLAETLRECLVADSSRGAGREGERRYPGDGLWQLRIGGERHREESEGKG